MTTDQAQNTFPPLQKSKKVWFIIAAALLFPVILLIFATVQPKVFFDKSTLYYQLSANIFYIHWSVFLFLTVVFLHLIGKVSFKELGLEARKMGSVLWLFPAVWILEQLVLVIITLINSGEFRLNEIWLSNESILKAISSFISNLVATGLNEEVFFRGFLFIQLFLIFKAKIVGKNNRIYSLIISALLSSLIFAGCHLQFKSNTFLFLMLGGVVGCTIYFLTNNIFYGILLHGFFNSPLPLLPSEGDTAKFIVLGIIFAIIIMLSLKKRFRKKENLEIDNVE